VEEDSKFKTKTEKQNPLLPKCLYKSWTQNPIKFQSIVGGVGGVAEVRYYL